MSCTTGTCVIRVHSKQNEKKWHISSYDLESAPAYDDQLAWGRPILDRIISLTLLLSSEAMPENCIGNWTSMLYYCWINWLHQHLASMISFVLAYQIPYSQGKSVIWFSSSTSTIDHLLIYVFPVTAPWNIYALYHCDNYTYIIYLITTYLSVWPAKECSCHRWRWWSVVFAVIGNMSQGFWPWQSTRRGIKYNSSFLCSNFAGLHRSLSSSKGKFS